MNVGEYWTRKMLVVVRAATKLMDNKTAGRDCATLLLIATKRSEKGSTLFVLKSSVVDAKNSPVK